MHETFPWDYVDRSGGLAACWPWTRALDTHGYGAVWRQGGMRLAHRLVYALAFPHDPSPTVVRHACDNRPCCNPLHLAGGTVSENQRDTRDRGAGGYRQRLRPADVAVIRERLANGESDSSIARAFGVTRQNIGMIRRGQTWSR